MQRPMRRSEMGTFHFSENPSPLHFDFSLFPAVLERSEKVGTKGKEVIQDMDNCQDAGSIKKKIMGKAPRYLLG